MPITMEQLKKVAFDPENFPHDIPTPGPETIKLREAQGNKELYRYQIDQDGQAYAAEILVDRDTVENPAEGVSFMLNQFAYLWRMSRDKVKVASDGSCYQVPFG